jgi:hypothetical protein
VSDDYQEPVRRVHVKEDPETGEFLVMELTTLENFTDDAERYGIDVALENLNIIIADKGHQ